MGREVLTQQFLEHIFQGKLQLPWVLEMLVICAYVEESMLVLLGPEKSVRLGKLNASKRNWNFEPSVTLNSLKRDASVPGD